jgi:hypothetical protein
MPKLSVEDVRKIYRRAWLNDSPQELAKKYNVSVSTIISIKQGRTWSKITGHVEGTIPDFILHKKKPRVISEKENMIIRDAWTTEMLSEYSGMMALNELSSLLDDAVEFNQMFWQYRTEKGQRGKRFPASEVNEFFNEYKNGLRHNDND